MGGILLLAAPAILGVYKVSPEVTENARKLILVLSCVIWLRASNHTLIIGVMRSGGIRASAF